MKLACLVAAALLLAVPVASAEPLPDPVEPAHKDVYIDLMNCLWKGSYKKYAETPLVTVWVYTCDSPDT